MSQIPKHKIPMTPPYCFALELIYFQDHFPHSHSHSKAGLQKNPYYYKDQLAISEANIIATIGKKLQTYCLKKNLKVSGWPDFYH